MKSRVVDAHQPGNGQKFTSVEMSDFEPVSLETCVLRDLGDIPNSQVGHLSRQNLALAIFMDCLGGEL
jgi:hypothetical protein